MIKMTKLRLINWHLFSNETTDIDGITFLTGANGTGKSTIIDAMQIVLVGDTTNRNFNKAANDKSTRTLTGYLKGDTGETAGGEITYLRNGRFSSYIALQFHDDKKDSDFTLGVVFDTYEDETHDHSFFYIASKFPTNDFTRKDKGKDRPCTAKEFGEYVRSNYEQGSYRFFESNASYQVFLKSIFGNLPDKYFSIFRKAISFTPITNISTFITEFVCDIDHHIDVEPMRKNIEQYRLLQMEAKRIKDKVTALTDIHAAYEAFKKTKSDSALGEYLVERVKVETSVSQIAKYKKQVELNASRLDEIAALIKEYNGDISALEAKKEALVAKKVGSDNYSAFASIEAKKDALKAKIVNAKNSYDSLVASIKGYNYEIKSCISSLVEAKRSINDIGLSESTKSAINEFGILAHNALKSINSIEDAVAGDKLNSSIIKSYQRDISGLIRSANNLSHIISNDLTEAYNKFNGLNGELSRMNGGDKPFPSGFVSVKNELERELKKRHSDAKVEVFCDLIDINDKRWVKAIEVAIYSQKFNLFVNEEYFEEANEIMKQIMNHNFFRVSIVDSERLIDRNFNERPGSIATLIDTDHEGARAYANYLLSGIAKCETFQEARDSGSGLLADCTGYRSFSTWYLNKNLGEVAYIGTTLSKDAIASKKGSFNVLNDYIEKLRAFYNIICRLASSESMSQSEADNANRVLTRYEEAQHEFESQQSILNEDMSSSELEDVNVLNDKIKQIQDDIDTLNRDKEALIKEQGSLEGENKNIEDNLIPSLVHAGDNFDSDMEESFGKEFLESVAEPFYNEAIKTMSLEKIRSDAENLNRVSSYKIKSAKDKLLNLRSIYVAANSLGYNTSDENSNKEYDDDLAALTTIALPEYEKKIEEARQKSIKEFRDDFIYKLRTCIETVKSQIDELNLALKDVKFGKDSYRFTVAPNRDFMEYYEMITSDLLLAPKKESDDFNKKYGRIMEDLFALISNSDAEDAEERAKVVANIEKFTDYRTYLNFDLLVKRGSIAIESSLSRTFRRQSGGETQTPFYISILASFAQMYRISNEKNNDTLRLVIFDEAFSKMDSARIKEVVALIKHFGLQAVLSTPSEKIRDLASSVDLIVVAMHDAKRTRSYLDRYSEI